MDLAEKILQLRRQQGLSQEALADRLGVSRQAVSRWEQRVTQPDAGNLLQLSQLFGVSADYLLRDDWTAPQPPAAPPPEPPAARHIRWAGWLCTGAGALGSFVLYVLSRTEKVIVPRITWENGEKWYHYSSDFMDYSYHYYLQARNLELLADAFWLLLAVGLFLWLVWPRRARIRAALARGWQWWKAHTR